MICSTPFTNQIYHVYFILAYSKNHCEKLKKRDCVLACRSEFYGIDCIEECGQCRDIDQCHHINGTCLTGCAAGYQGDLCKTRRYRCNNDNVQ